MAIEASGRHQEMNERHPIRSDDEVSGDFSTSSVKACRSRVRAGISEAGLRWNRSKSTDPTSPDCISDIGSAMIVFVTCSDDRWASRQQQPGRILQEADVPITAAISQDTWCFSTPKSGRCLKIRPFAARHNAYPVGAMWGAQPSRRRRRRRTGSETTETRERVETFTDPSTSDSLLVAKQAEGFRRCLL